jgi:hypothetical protein
MGIGHQVVEVAGKRAVEGRVSEPRINTEFAGQMMRDNEVAARPGLAESGSQKTTMLVVQRGRVSWREEAFAFHNRSMVGDGRSGPKLPDLLCRRARSVVRPKRGAHEANVIADVEDVTVKNADAPTWGAERITLTVLSISPP